MVGIASDMSHEDFYIFDLEEEVLGILHPNYMVVDVAINCSQGLECCQLFSGFNRADIPCMPNLVHIFKEGEDLGDEGPMSVGKQTNTSHGILFKG